MVSYEHGVSSGWSLIRPALYQVGLFTRVSLYQHPTLPFRISRTGKREWGGGSLVKKN